MLACQTTPTSFLWCNFTCGKHFSFGMNHWRPQATVKTGSSWLGTDERGKCDSIGLSAACLSNEATICSMVVAVVWAKADQFWEWLRVLSCVRQHESTRVRVHQQLSEFSDKLRKTGKKLEKTAGLKSVFFFRKSQFFSGQQSVSPSVWWQLCRLPVFQTLRLSVYFSIYQ